MNRRRFLQAGAARIGAGALGLSAAAGAAAGMAPLERLLGQQPGQEPLAGQGANGSLRDPDAAGRPLSATTAADNDEAIKQIEQHLHCTCGCNLDIYTCRTTDFSCSYSPELHKEVVALYDSGKTAQQIVDAFVAKYGEKVLMAPPAEGFNLAGYLVPGALIALAGAGVVAIVSRRGAVAAAEGGVPRVPPMPPPATSTATPEELDRLRRELTEVDD